MIALFISRSFKQEEDRRVVECKLMAFEDFMFSQSDESRLRVRRAEERTKVRSGYTSSL
jgi:hypothetical protein